jgi:hypothetical protein
VTLRIISFVTIPAIGQPESTINMESNTPQTAHDGRFSIRSAFDCHLAHICSEAWEAYLKTYKPLFGDPEGYPIIYVNLEKDAIQFGHFEMRYLHRALQGILEISFLIPRLKVLTFVPHAGLGSGDKSLDWLIRTKYQFNNQSQWVLRLIKTKPSCNPARINPEHWRESRKYEEKKCSAFLDTDFRKKREHSERRTPIGTRVRR